MAITFEQAVQATLGELNISERKTNMPLIISLYIVEGDLLLCDLYQQ